MTILQKGYKYKPDYWEQVRKHMVKGYSFSTFGCNIGVYKQTLYDSGALPILNLKRPPKLELGQAEKNLKDFYSELYN